jgi:hypothetical protein
MGTSSAVRFRIEKKNLHSAHSVCFCALCESQKKSIIFLCREEEDNDKEGGVGNKTDNVRIT